jgi:hypothetical protein
MSQNDFMAPAAFARLVGVSRQAIAKAVRVGRVPVYDEAFSRVKPEYKGRKFIKCDEGSSAFRLSRARIDDRAIAEANAKIDHDFDPTQSGFKEQLRAACQSLRSEREHRQRLQRALKAVFERIQIFAVSPEEIVELAQTKGVGAVDEVLSAERRAMIVVMRDTLRSQPS